MKMENLTAQQERILQEEMKQKQWWERSQKRWGREFKMKLSNDKRTCEPE